MSPRPPPARTSSCNVCIRPASPPVLAPNDPTGVQALSAARNPPGHPVEMTAGGAHQTSVSTSADPLAAGSSTSIPWTIANKYYTADVHFEAHEFEHFRVHHAVGVPAIIYVWGPGEVSLSPFQTPPHWRLISCLADVCVSNSSACLCDVG